jgi:mannose-6-phosphate isomerase-like protein (cupin superfamily)
MPEPHFFDLVSTEWTTEARFPGIEFKVLETRATHPAVSMVAVRVGVGVTINTHTHPVETETVIVTAGEGLLTIDEQQTVMTVGKGGSIPPGHPHSMANTGDVPLELIAIHTPATR